MKFWLCTVFVQAAFLIGAHAVEWTEILPPDSSGNGIRVTGFEGNKIVGFYSNTSDQTVGFIYDGVDWDILTNPWSSNNGLNIQGIHNGVVFGNMQGGPGGGGPFFYDGNTFVYPTLAEPSLSLSFGSGQDGVIGGWGLKDSVGGTKVFSFVYEGGGFTILAPPPGAKEVVAYGADPGGMVGYYDDAEDVSHGVYFHDGVWEDIAVPGAVGETIPTVVQDGRLAGLYRSAENVLSGFIWEDGLFTTFDIPGALNTSIFALEGDRIGGTYYGTDGKQHGFVATIPEPTTLGLMGIGGLMLLPRRRIIMG